MKYFLVCLFCMVVAINCNELVDYRLSPLNSRALTFENENGVTTTAAPPKEFKCEKPGLQCNECDSVYNCVDIGGGAFLPIQTDKCTGGKTCNDGACSTDASYECGALNEIGFKCTKTGMFPDPANCQKYYICVETAPKVFEKYHQTCANKSNAYDMTRTYCSLKMGPNKQCPASTIVPICKQAGTTFVLSNKSIFGMCLTDFDAQGNAHLVPRLYLCPNGGTYSPTTYKCT